MTGRMEGTDLGGTMARVQNVVNRLQIPSSVRVEYGGTYQEQQRSFADLARVLVVALALVFGVLLIEFRNFAAPLAIPYQLHFVFVRGGARAFDHGDRF